MMNQIGLDLRIETPENVVLTYQLAGPALRAQAYAIDFVFRVMIMIGALVLASIVGIFLSGLAIGSLLLVLFLLEWGYTIGFEYAWQGRTPGKWLLGLRVIQENGRPLSWWSSGLRNLLRVADVLPLIYLFGSDLGIFGLLPVYGPGVITMFCSPRLQRMGDLAARTVVIQERRARIPGEPVIFEKIEPLARSDLNSFAPRPRTLSLIDRFLGRRHVLLIQRGHALALPLAEALARRLNFASDPQSVRKYPMAFLARVYVTFAARRDEAPTEGDGSDRPRRRRARQPEGVR
ncbi:MAG: RDD family protein [Planctomycetaceae bacterium]